jgi:glycerol-3-phosphate O-acyltransferase/dihydroxyacetone phosphate acyltransferase
MERKAVGFFARLMDSSTFIMSYFPLPADFCSVPVSRASDEAKPGTGLVYLSLDDPCLVLGEGTKFKAEFVPKMQIMLPKSVNSAVAEVVEVISDTELRIKKEFGGDSGKGTIRIREKIGEGRENGDKGLAFKVLPFINQQEMYRGVYQKLKEGGCIGIFPEGKPTTHQFHCSVSLHY